MKQKDIEGIENFSVLLWKKYVYLILLRQVVGKERGRNNLNLFFFFEAMERLSLIYGLWAKIQ